MGGSPQRVETTEGGNHGKGETMEGWKPQNHHRGWEQQEGRNHRNGGNNRGWKQQTVETMARGKQQKGGNHRVTTEGGNNRRVETTEGENHGRRNHRVGT